MRACFAEELESHRPDAWQEGNRRLYEHLRQAVPDLPETLEAMQLLYAAVVHGCRAGLQQEVLDEVYWRRILRGDGFYSTKKLGAFGSELTALAGFFDRPWGHPSVRLTAADQAFILNQAAFRLRALGRLMEAVEPMQAGLEAHVAQEDWENAAASASNLSELTLTLGDVPRAVAFGEQSVELADRSGNAFHRVDHRTVLADALHQEGRWEESAATFRDAAAMQAEWQPQYPRLYSLAGFRYCDLLLGQEEPEADSGLDGLASLASKQKEAERFREVLKHARQTLEWAGRSRGVCLPRPPGPRCPPALPFRLCQCRHGSHRGSGDCRAWPDAPPRVRRAPRMGAPLPGSGGSRYGATACGAGAGVSERDRVWAAGARGAVVGGDAR